MIDWLGHFGKTGIVAERWLWTGDEIQATEVTLARYSPVLAPACSPSHFFPSHHSTPYSRLSLMRTDDHHYASSSTMPTTTKPKRR